LFATSVFIRLINGTEAEGAPDSSKGFDVESGQRDGDSCTWRRQVALLLCYAVDNSLPQLTVLLLITGVVHFRT